MNIISAIDARHLDPNLRMNSDLEQLDQLIRTAAAEGKTAIRVPYNLCKFDGHSAWFRAPSLESRLADAGYQVVTRSEDRQFVDVWIEVSWHHIPV